MGALAPWCVCDQGLEISVGSMEMPFLAATFLLTAIELSTEVEVHSFIVRN